MFVQKSNWVNHENQQKMVASLLTLQWNMGPIHKTFHSFCNEFHENSLQWIQNWKSEQQVNTEWTSTSTIDQMKYMGHTHVHCSDVDF
jgi:hypothetical protein